MDFLSHVVCRDMVCPTWMTVSCSKVLLDDRWRFLMMTRRKIMNVGTPHNEIMNHSLWSSKVFHLNFISPTLHLKWGKESPYHLYLHVVHFYGILWHINVGKCTNCMDPMGYIYIWLPSFMQADECSNRTLFVLHHLPSDQIVSSCCCSQIHEHSQIGGL